MPLTDATDANLDLDLLRRMRAGDATTTPAAADALSALYRRHQGPLYRFSILRTGSADVAADIVQDVFMALIENKLAFDATRGALSSFLFGVARNFALKRDEVSRRHVALDDSEDCDNDLLIDQSITPIEKLLADHRAEAVRCALMRLAPHYRDVVILYEMHDMSYVEIANICHIDIGTVRSRLSRAREKLVTILNPLNEHSAPHDTAAIKHHKARP